MAASTRCITVPSTLPIRSRSRRLSSVRICSNRITESLGRPQHWAATSIWVGSLAFPVWEVMAAAMTVGLWRLPVADMERMASEIEQEVQNSLEREVSTEIIGEKVMEKLKKADEVAYVRFASVYRQFKDINTFMSELNKLLSEK